MASAPHVAARPTHLQPASPPDAADTQEGTTLPRLIGATVFERSSFAPASLLDPRSKTTITFKCRACGSREVALFAIESQAELEAVRRTLLQTEPGWWAPTNYSERDPEADLPASGPHSRYAEVGRGKAACLVTGEGDAHGLP